MRPGGVEGERGGGADPHARARRREQDVQAGRRVPIMALTLFFFFLFAFSAYHGANFTHHQLVKTAKTLTA